MEAKIVEEQILKRGYSDEYEKEYIRKDGTVFPISARVWLVRDEDGKPQGMWGIARDITERKRAEEALAQSEEKHRTLSQNIPGMVYRGRPDWSTEIISNSESISGYAAQEFNSGKSNWLDIIHPDDRERVRKEVLALEEKPHSIIQEYRIITKDGSIRWVEDHKTSLFKDGVFQGVDGIVFDFTKRRRAEQALRLLEVKYQALFESSPEGILIADLRNQEFKYANPAMCKLLGYSQEEFTTMAKKDLKPKESVEYVLPESYPQARGEKPPVQNIPLMKKDGKTIYVDINTVNALIDDRECVIAFFRDVSARKKGRESFKKKSKEMALLDEVATRISEAQNLKEAADRTLEVLCKGLKLPMARLYVLDEGQEVLRLLTVYGASEKVFQQAKDIKLGRLPVGRAAEKKALEVWAFSRLVTIEQDVPGRQSKARLAAALPLVSKEKVLGVIYFWGWSERMFTSDELHLLKTIGAQVAMAIEKAHLFKEAALERDRSAALAKITQAISKTLDLKEVAKRSLDLVLEVIQLEAGSIYVFDEDQSALRMIIHLGPGKKVAEKYKEIKAGRHFIWRAAAQRKVSMPGSSPRARQRKQHKPSPKSTCSGRPIALPLISKGKVRGVMVVGSPGKDDYTPDELNFLKTISTQVATAVENAYLFEKANTERHRSEALREVGEAVTSTLDLKKVLELITERSTSLLGGEGGTAALLTPEKDRLKVVAASSEQKCLLGMSLPLDESLCGWVVSHGDPQIVEDALGDPRLSKKHLEKSKVRNCIVAPLKLRGEVRGTIFIQNKKGPGRAFTKEDLSLLVAFANHASVAIENARLYQRAQENVAKLRALSTRVTNLQEEERARISNHLHSNLAQTLTTAKMNLDLICQQTGQHSPQLRTSLSKVILMLEEAIQETRGLMLDLRNPVLDDLGLIPAVRSYAKDFFKRFGVKINVKVNHSLKDLSKHRRTMLFRIIQELLCNVRKHAEVSEAKLSLARRDGRDVVVVADSGKGFNPKSLRSSQSATSGLGLVAIREMVSRSKGCLTIDSAPGEGTTVTVRVPREVALA
jgi:PAS domain S-box-containing protein